MDRPILLQIQTPCGLRTKSSEELRRLLASLKACRTRCAEMISQSEEAIQNLERELANRERNALREMFCAAPIEDDYTFVDDPRGRNEYISEEFLDATGWTRRQIIGMGWVEILERERLREILPPFLTAIACEKPYAFDAVIRLNRGGRAKIRTITVPKHGERREYLGVVGKTWRID